MGMLGEGGTATPDEQAGAPLRPGDIAGALGWWREAGVDLDFADAPTPWLTADQPDNAPPPGPFAQPPRAAAEAVPPAARIGGDPALWPQRLDDFAGWWLAEPSLDGGMLRGRVAPRGPAGAELMIVVGQPEADDAERLLAGREGRLLGAIMAAMGLTEAAVYLAAALPRHTPAADWAGLAANGLGAVLAHHIALVQPRRVLVFGEGALSLLGHDPAQKAQPSSPFYQEGQTIPLMGTRDLGLLTRPAWKARLWRDWLDWTGTTTL